MVLGDEEDLKKTEMSVAGINWMKYDSVSDDVSFLTKIRYKDKGAFSTLHSSEKGVDVHFFEEVKGIAPGQSAVFYENDDVVGGGIIQRNKQPLT